MANKADKYRQNAAGKYYVDTACIDCDLCQQIAPHNFTRNDSGGHSFVKRQPRNDSEIHQCREAKESCPVEAIGNNG